MSDKQLLDDLLALREWLTPRRHWWQGAYGHVRGKADIGLSGNNPRITEEEGTTCLLGGCQHVTGETDLLRSRNRVMTDALADCLPDGFHSIHRFNDARSTKHADVLAVVDCAIEKAR